MVIAAPTALTGCGRYTDSIISRVPDAAVIAEPTNLDVVVAHKGAVRWRVPTLGHAAAQLAAAAGENAIYKMAARVVAASEKYAADVPASLAAASAVRAAEPERRHISGGLSVNTVPDRATSKSIAA